MKKITIKFVQFGVDGFSSCIGFETSIRLLEAVVKGFYTIDRLDAGGTIELKNINVYDNLFDYETGTMWEVMEVEK